MPQHRDPIETAGRVIETTSAGLSLVERLANIFRTDPLRKAARLRGRAAKKRAKAVGKSPRRAATLLAAAQGLEAQADALEASAV